MNFYKSVLVLATLLLLSACAKREPASIPIFSDGGLLKNSAALPTGALASLNGLFAVNAGTNLLGDGIAVHVVRETLSLFSSRKDIFAILKGGCLNSGSELVLEGYWRAPKSSQGGLVRLYVKPAAVAAALCQGNTVPPEPLQLEGETLQDRNRATTALAFSFSKPLTDLTSKFQVIAHRGACRTIDECGYSENSLESLRQIEYFGGSMIETDIQLTRDGIPVMYHDEELSDRLVRGPFCHGPVSSFSLSELRKYCRLVYGEQIPTLEDLLTTLISETTLQGAYLDMKSPAAVPTVIQTVKNALSLASSSGRAVRLLIGLPSQEVKDAYLGVQASGVECLIEENSDDLAKYGCGTWSPRFTEGPMSDQVKAVRASGSSVFFWTMNDLRYLDYYLVNSRPDGIVTDRPGLLFHRAQLNAGVFSLEVR